MNITELARILKITTQELRDKLPLMGFDIGQKAIKVDNQIAHKIIGQWPVFKRQLEAKKLKEDEQKQTETLISQSKKEVVIPSFITVRDFSLVSGLPVNRLLAELMKNGIFSSLNEKIDYDTAAIIGADLGLEVKPAEEQAEQVNGEGDRLKQVLSHEDKDQLLPRPPVIVVMGHVDHGKTKLLDAIRSTDVAAGEAGGITQHIGAYQITHKNKVITFIDTPGHEAFTAMRNRGARIADIAILVVAADDGVKPQTVEAFRIMEAAKVPFVVAINKIDKPEANIEKTKQELANQLNIIPEDWGGKTVCVPISAKEHKGLDELLDVLILTAELEADNIKANPNASAIGTIIESHIDKGEGPVATVLIQNGTLKISDPLCFNNSLYGKVRALKDYRNQGVAAAMPSQPVRIIGLKIAPAIGDILEVGLGEKLKTKQIKGIFTESSVKPAEEAKDDQREKINLIIKSDVLGSGEAIEGSLYKIDSQAVKVNILYKGLGNITEGDISRAQASQAEIFGFNVKIAPLAQNMAREKNIKIKIYKIIYELINDVKNQVQELTKPEFKRVDVGKMKVVAVFRTENNGQIVGGRIIEGLAEKNTLLEVWRDQEFITQGKLIRLQSGKQDVSRAEINQEAGIQFEGKPLIKTGDTLRFYKEEAITQKAL